MAAGIVSEKLRVSASLSVESGRARGLVGIVRVWFLAFYLCFKKEVTSLATTWIWNEFTNDLPAGKYFRKCRKIRGPTLTSTPGFATSMSAAIEQRNKRMTVRVTRRLPNCLSLSKWTLMESVFFASPVLNASTLQLVIHPLCQTKIENLLGLNAALAPWPLRPLRKRGCVRAFKLIKM